MAAIDRMLCQVAEHFLYIGTEEIETLGTVRINYPEIFVDGESE